MNLRRILILLTLELVCSGLALSQNPASQSAGDGQSQAPASKDQNQGAGTASPDTVQPKQQAPAPLLGGPFGAEQQASAEENKPATHFASTLSGAEVFAPVAGGEGPSYVLPAVQFATYANSNPGGTSGASSVNGQAYLTGSLRLQRVRKSSQLNLGYQGGEFFNFGPSFVNNGRRSSSYGSHQSLFATESIRRRHWQLLVADQLSYLPESAFGFVGFAGLDTIGFAPGGGGFYQNPVFNTTLQPNQTILTGAGRRLSNSAMTEVEYSRGRSAITATAVYGTLHFLDPRSIDSNSWTVLAGYNYSLTRRDVIAITALYSDFTFNGKFPGVTYRGVLLNYGRKLTHRLYLEASAGPGSSKSTVPGVGNVTRTTWRTFDSLMYTLPRGSFGLIYSRATTAGSGVLIGAENDWVSLVADRALSHTFHGSLNLGYAHNRSLEKTAGANQSKFNTWQAGVTVGRSFGDLVNAYLYFNVLRQASNASVCSRGDCGTDVFRYVIGLGLNWHARPLRLR